MDANVVSSTSDKQSDGIEPTCFMINVHSGASPLTVHGLDGPAFQGFTVFATRSREEGRDRHRVHLGYFASAESAASILGLVRLRYPAAWVVPCPAPGARTNAAVSATARNVAAPLIREALPEVHPDLFCELTLALDPPLEPEVPVRASASVREEVAPPAAASNDPFELFDAPFYPLELVPDPAPARDQVQEGSLKVPLQAPPPAGAQAPEGDLAFVETVTLSESQVLRVLEDGACVRGESASEHAVQVLWSETPIDLRLVPKSPMFTEYTLYPFRGVYRGHRGYGLRLGFFKEQYAAEQVAAFLRPDYEQSLVVKVSDKERLAATPAARPGVVPRRVVPSAGVKVSAAAPARPPLREASSRIITSAGRPTSSNNKPAGKPQSWFKGLVRRWG